MNNLNIHLHSVQNPLRWLTLLGILILSACQPSQSEEIKEPESGSLTRDAELTPNMSTEEVNNAELTSTDEPQPDSSGFLETPPPRAGHAMVYDNFRQKIVLFGGSQTISQEERLFNQLNDTWEYDGISWTQIETSHSPKPRSIFSMIYNDVEEKIIAFGSDKEFPSPWQYDGQDWQEIDAAVPLMPETAVYYPKMGEVNTPYQCWQKCDANFYMTWHFDGKTWYEGNEIFPYGDIGQDPFFYPQIVHDSARDVIVFQLQWPWTFEFDGKDWTLIHSVDDVEDNLPRLAASFNMVYDNHREVVVLYGVIDGQEVGRTWEYSEGNWQEIILETNPPPRVWSSMAFDEVRGVTVLFGGEWEAQNFNDLWEYDGIRWIERFPSESSE